VIDLSRKTALLGIANAAMIAALVSIAGGSTKLTTLAAAAVAGGTLLGMAANNWLDRHDIAPME